MIGFKQRRVFAVIQLLFVFCVLDVTNFFKVNESTQKLFFLFPQACYYSNMVEAYRLEAYFSSSQCSQARSYTYSVLQVAGQSKMNIN